MWWRVALQHYRAALQALIAPLHLGRQHLLVHALERLQQQQGLLRRSTSREIRRNQAVRGKWTGGLVGVQPGR